MQSTWKIDGNVSASPARKMSARGAQQARGSFVIAHEVQPCNTDHVRTGKAPCVLPVTNERPNTARRIVGKQQQSSIAHDCYGTDAAVVPTEAPTAAAPAPLAHVSVAQLRNKNIGSHVLGAADKASTPVKNHAIRTARAQQTTGIQNAIAWD